MAPSAASVRRRRDPAAPEPAAHAVDSSVLKKGASLTTTQRGSMGSDDTAKEARPLLSPRKSIGGNSTAFEVKIMQPGTGGGSNGGSNGGGQQGGVRPFREVLPSWLALCRLWFQGADSCCHLQQSPTPIVAQTNTAVLEHTMQGPHFRTGEVRAHIGNRPTLAADCRPPAPDAAVQAFSTRLHTEND